MRRYGYNRFRESFREQMHLSFALFPRGDTAVCRAYSTAFQQPAPHSKKSCIALSVREMKYSRIRFSYNKVIIFSQIKNKKKHLRQYVSSNLSGMHTLPDLCRRSKAFGGSRPPDCRSGSLSEVCQTAVCQLFDAFRKSPSPSGRAVPRSSCPPRPYHSRPPGIFRVHIP